MGAWSDSDGAASSSAIRKGAIGARRGRANRSASKPPAPANDSAAPEFAHFPFDLVLNSAEPWKLAVTDVHGFHVVTAALGALLASRSSLPAFAVTLSLGSSGTAVPVPAS